MSRFGLGINSSGLRVVLTFVTWFSELICYVNNEGNGTLNMFALIRITWLVLWVVRAKQYG